MTDENISISKELKDNISFDNNFVYHSSIKSGLKIIQPSLSSHGKDYVYAAKDKLISLTFLKRKDIPSGDFTCWKGRNPDTGKVAIVERYPGAFKDIYSDVAGSLYILPAKSFTQNTQWNEEVLSTLPVSPIKEISINNIWNLISQLNDNGEIEVYFYPNRPRCVAKDDSDLFRRANERLKKHGLESIQSLQTIHPKIYEKLVKVL